MMAVVADMVWMMVGSVYKPMKLDMAGLWAVQTSSKHWDEGWMAKMKQTIAMQ